MLSLLSTLLLPLLPHDARAQAPPDSLEAVETVEVAEVAEVATGSTSATTDAPRWPAPGTLRAAPVADGRLVLPGPALERPLRVALDPGHGVLNEEGELSNPGMEAADCTSEHDFTLELARDLAARLEATGQFEVVLLRTVEAGPPYPDRWALAAAQEAEVFLSLHMDSRGEATGVEVGGRTCSQRAEEPGFSVLFSMEGDDALDARRGGLARTLSAELRGRGFPAYDGADYGGAYDIDPVPGVFIDGRGLAMLRRPAMPSVIVEALHAWHPEEWERWKEEGTRQAFAYAMAMGLRQWAGEHRGAL